MGLLKCGGQGSEKFAGWPWGTAEGQENLHVMGTVSDPSGWMVVVVV